MELNTQLRIKELEISGVRAFPGAMSEPSFDVSKHIKFVSIFSENKVDKHFSHF